MSRPAASQVKSLYIRVADVEVWKQTAALAANSGESLSAYVARLLRDNLIAYQIASRANPAVTRTEPDLKGTIATLTFIGGPR